MSSHRIIRWENGQVSVEDAQGRAMHSRIGPIAEAHSVYLEPSRLVERLSSDVAEPLVLLDVGMGLATNVVVALEALAGLKRPSRPLRIESFETQTEGLELALATPEAFPWLEPHRGPLDQLLEKGTWKSEAPFPIEWRLHRGDFRDALDGLPDQSVELVFFDFYAPKTCPELWSPVLFERLARKLNPATGLLATYSSATPVRAALLLAGWYLAAGPKTAAKLDTTLAALSPDALPQESLLGETWKRKLDTSTQVAPEALLPSGSVPEERARIDAAIRERLRSHPQWALPPRKTKEHP
jgi:queuine tRNA-ribosyltransferase